jgi:hypothetical protein
MECFRGYELLRFAVNVKTFAGLTIYAMLNS